MSYAEQIELKIVDNINDVKRKVDKLDDSVNKTKKSSKGLGLSFKNLLGAAALIGGTMIALNKLKDAMVFSVKAAIDYGESLNKLNVVYKSLSKNEVEGSIKRLRNEFGLSNKSATEYLSNIGDLLTGFGLTQKRTLDLSTEIVGLSTDLSSFANIPVDQAVNAITKAMVGEREMLKSLGVVVTDAMVDTRELVEIKKLEAEGFNGSRVELERTARANATYNLILDQSTNAVGDFQRSLDSSVPNQYRSEMSEHKLIIRELNIL